MFRTEQYITRAMVRAEPKTLWAFGDNMVESGFGGQAAVMRGEPNAVGIPTKWLPSRVPAAYFSDADYPKVEPVISARLFRIAQHLNHGGDVVWPADGIGTGLAELPIRAPTIHALIAAARILFEQSNNQ